MEWAQLGTVTYKPMLLIGGLALKAGSCLPSSSGSGLCMSRVHHTNVSGEPPRGSVRPKLQLLSSATCGHVLQHLQQHVLGLIDQLGSLHHQLPQAQIAIQHCAHQATLKVPFDGFHLNKGGEKAYGDTKQVL